MSDPVGLFEAVQAHAAREPDAAAILVRSPDGLRRTTYGELARESERYAERFEAATPARALIPMYAGKSPSLVAAVVGALGAGRAFSCLNKKLKAPQLRAVLTQSGAGLALLDGPGVMLLRRLPEMDPVLAATTWWVVPDGRLSAHDQAAAFLVKQGVRVEAAEAAPAAPGFASAGGDAVGCCLFTSGSTGRPKGVLIAASDLYARARAEVRFFGLSRDDVLLSILPFSFDVGLNQMMSALAAGCTLVLLESWLPADILKAAAECGVTGISGVPSIWQDMLNVGLRFDTDGAHAELRYLTVSGGDLLPDQLERLEGLAPGAGIFKTYGQTEAFRPTALPPEEFAIHRASVGRAFASARVYVVGDHGPCAPNEIGEVVHTGLGTMLGYLDGNDPQEKLRANPFQSREDPADKAVFTGDLGYLDEAGYLHLRGRRDHMLKIEGNRVYPSEIAEHVTRLADVLEAQIVGVTDGSDKLQLVAFVTTVDGADFDAERARRALLRVLPTYMMPKAIARLPAMPRTASGKPDVPALKERARSLLAASDEASASGGMLQ